MLSSGASEYENVVTVDVVWATEEQRAELRDRYGDALRLTPALEPAG